jgi:putative PIN family toxin of toxin-antitoxin system
LRVVIDTNILISAIFWGGKPKRLLNSVRRGEVIFLTTETLLAELREVLTSKDRPFRLSDKDTNIIIDHLGRIAHLVSPTIKINVCRDEADNCVLECALDGNADSIVTGDNDLLDLKTFKGIRIVRISDLPF